eukprot:279785-Amphidinium_carterae.1
MAERLDRLHWLVPCFLLYFLPGRFVDSEVEHIDVTVFVMDLTLDMIWISSIRHLHSTLL